MASDPHEALRQANAIRALRSELKGFVRSRPTSANAVIGDPPSFARSMPAADLLMQLPLVGPRRLSLMLRKAGVPSGAKLGDLTDRQRDALRREVDQLPSLRHEANTGTTSETRFGRATLSPAERYSTTPEERR